VKVFARYYQNRRGPAVTPGDGGRLTRPRRASHEAKNRARARFFGGREAWSSDGLELTDNLVADLVHRSDSMDLDVLGGAFAALLGP